MDIQEVIDLKKQLEDEFKKNTDAIDLVLALLEKRSTNGQTAQSITAAEASPEPIVVENDAPKSKDVEVLQPQSRKFDFADDIQSNGNDNGHGNKNGNKFGRVRDTGVKGIAKQAVKFLPQDFQRKDLIATIATHFPEWNDKLTKDAINGALARLLEDGLVRVKVKARGKFPATLTKIETN